MMYHSSETPSTSKFILIVDDVVDNIILLEFMLEELGYRTDNANSGESALEILEKEIPDMILLDLMMPDMNGVEVARILRQQNHTQHIPIILVTAYDTNDFDEDELETLINGVLIKPVDSDLLEEMLASIFSNN